MEPERGRRGPGRRRPLQHRTGGQRPPCERAPGWAGDVQPGLGGRGRRAAGGMGRPDRGAAGRAGRGLRAGRRLPSRGCGRAVSGGARSGRPDPCGAPGTAAAAEGHGEEGASHGGAPRPPPAERDEEGGAAAARGRCGGGSGSRAPSVQNPAPGPTQGDPGFERFEPARASSLPAAPNPRYCAPIRAPRCGPGGLPPFRRAPHPVSPGYFVSASWTDPHATLVGKVLPRPGERRAWGWGRRPLTLPLRPGTRGKGFPGAG